MKRLLPILILLLFAFQTIPYLNDGRRFHPDEAFFMTFARHAAIGGDWWLQGSLDKPPLTIYANALMITLIGADTLPDGVLTLDPIKGEFVGRLFSFFSGMILVAVTIQLALDLSKRTLVAFIAGMVLATLPMMHLYSASAFMDMPMVALAMAALLAATRRKPAASGILLALAFAAKPQAVFFAPLVVWYVWQNGKFASLFRFIGAAVLGVVCLFLWDALRPGDSVFALGAANNDFFAPTLNPSLLWQRCIEWLPLHTPLWAFSPIGLMLILGIGIGLCYRPTRVFSAWVMVYVVSHVMLFDTLYERYLLLITPVIITAATCPLVVWSHVSWKRQKRKKPTCHPVILTLSRVFIVIYLGFWVWVMSPQREGTEPAEWSKLDDYNSDPARIDLLANELQSLPTASIIYDHWFGWLLRYYLGEWHDKRIVYFPSPQEMADHAWAQPETQNRYFLLPIGDPARYGLSSAWSTDPEAFIAALESAGFQLIGNQVHGFATIELIPLTQ